MLLIVALVFAVFFLFQTAKGALPHFFFVPPTHWQDKIKKHLDHPKPVYLKVGAKRSSFRKRLVGASFDPQHYSNYKDNKILFLPSDIKSKDDFLATMKHRLSGDLRRSILYGFFHPYANNGGGGEKVLWEAIYATLAQNSENIVVVYTTNVEALPQEILHKAQLKFDVKDMDSKRIVFVYLRKFSKWIDSDSWKHFTMIGQLLGSILLALEAIFELTPDVWIDTMGLPGSYFPISVILKIPIVAYVHYPIIQLDMFNKLKFRSLADLTSLRPSLGDLKALVKFFYWTALYYFYVYLGSCVNVTFTNGSWTFNHMSRIWSLNQSLGRTIEKLYPPCSTESLINQELTTAPREEKLLYIAQFRPEKRHSLVLEEFSKFLQAARSASLPIKDIPKIVFLGSCRTPEDSGTLENLQALTKELDLAEYVEFIVDCSYDEVKEQLKKCNFGLNAMWNEHFGIGVVEYVSSGAIPIVHASAGPLLDICSQKLASSPPAWVPSTTWRNDVGFFFKSTDDPDFNGEEVDENLIFTQYVNEEKTEAKFPRLNEILRRLYIEKSISLEQLTSMRTTGSELMEEKFSNRIFHQKWLDKLHEVVELENQYREDRGKVLAVY